MSTDDFAESLVRVLASRREAGRVLHDDVGPRLSAAGLRLQLLAMDYPETKERVGEVLEVLEGAMERVRAVSQELNPSPVYRTGLKNSLAALIELLRLEFAGQIRFSFTTKARLPVEIAAAIYDAASGVLAVAVKSASRIEVSVTGAKRPRVRIRYNHQGSARPLRRAELLARHAGLDFEISTGKGTMIWITHAVQRSSRG